MAFPPQALMADPRLRKCCAARILAVSMWWPTDPKNPAPENWEGRAALFERVGLTRSSGYRALVELLATGWVEQIKVDRHGRKVRVYRLNCVNEQSGTILSASEDVPDEGNAFHQEGKVDSPIGERNGVIVPKCGPIGKEEKRGELRLLAKSTAPTPTSPPTGNTKSNETSDDDDGAGGPGDLPADHERNETGPGPSRLRNPSPREILRSDREAGGRDERGTRSPPPERRTAAAPVTRAAVEGLVLEIDTHRRAYAVTLQDPGRSRVQSSRLTLGREQADKHARNLASLVDELGLERVVAVMEHRWAQVGAGTMDPRMAACSFHGDGGGFAGSLAELGAVEERARRRAERVAPQDIDDRPCLSAADLMAASAGIDALGARAKPVEGSP